MQKLLAYVANFLCVILINNTIKPSDLLFFSEGFLKFIII